MDNQVLKLYSGEGLFFLKKRKQIRFDICATYMAQISKGGEDSKGMSFSFKLLDLNVIKNVLICMLGLLPLVQ